MSETNNEHVRCLFSEIPAFLSETETTRLLNLAENGRLESSDVFHNSMDTLRSQNSFEYWDLNRDDVINTDEVYIYTCLQRFRGIYHGLSNEIRTSLQASVFMYTCTKKTRVTSGIFHGIVRMSFGYNHKKYSAQHSRLL